MMPDKEGYAMKVSRERVAQNREMLLFEASRLFRERGFESVTVAEVSAAAGLTHGAFYSYFASKEDLIAQTCNYVLNDEDGQEYASLFAFAKEYLSNDHRENRGGGCLFAAVGTETARTSEATRDIITEKVREQIATFAKSAPGAGPRTRRRAAIGMWAAMMGAVMIARTVNDEALAKEITSSTMKWLEEAADLRPLE